MNSLHTACFHFCQGYVHCNVANTQSDGLKRVLGGMLLIGAWRGDVEETGSCEFSFELACGHPWTPWEDLTIRAPLRRSEGKQANAYLGAR